MLNSLGSLAAWLPDGRLVCQVLFINQSELGSAAAAVLAALLQELCLAYGACGGQPAAWECSSQH